MKAEKNTAAELSAAEKAAAFEAKFGLSMTEARKLHAATPGLLSGSIENLDPKTKADKPRLYFFFEKPNASVFALSAARAADKDILGMNKAFYGNCVKWADPAIVSGTYSDECQISVGSFIGSQFKLPEAQIEDFSEALS